LCRLLTLPQNRQVSRTANRPSREMSPSAPTPLAAQVEDPQSRRGAFPSPAEFLLLSAQILRPVGASLSLPLSFFHRAGPRRGLGSRLLLWVPSLVLQCGQFPFQMFYAGESVEVRSGQTTIPLPLPERRLEFVDRPFDFTHLPFEFFQFFIH